MSAHGYSYHPVAKGGAFEVTNAGRVMATTTDRLDAAAIVHALASQQPVFVGVDFGTGDDIGAAVVAEPRNFRDLFVHKARQGRDPRFEAVIRRHALEHDYRSLANDGKTLAALGLAIATAFAIGEAGGRRGVQEVIHTALIDADYLVLANDRHFSAEVADQALAFFAPEMAE
jgi:hypothetical protein